MSISTPHIRHLIEEEVTRYLHEQEEAPEPPADDPALDLGGDAEGGDLDLGGEGDMDLDGEGGDLDLGGEGGDGGGLGGGGGDLGDDGELGDDEGGDFDMGGGGFGGGGGGFSFGDDGDTGLEPDEEGEEEFASSVGPEDVEIPDDPVMAITDDAIAMLNQTRSPAPILKGIKASIQRYFNDVDDASPIIKTLWDTEDLILRDVARRLLLFIRGT